MIIDVDYILNVAKSLINTPSPSGYTDNVTKIVGNELKKYNIGFSLSKKGAIVASVKGKDTSSKKMIAVHLDTIGAIVKKIKPNGRLELTNIGRFSWASLEGENVTVLTMDGKKFTGTLMPTLSSVHIHGNNAVNFEHYSTNMEVRLDNDISNDNDTMDLGIMPGDFIFFDPRTVITETKYIKSRYLDDKICAALLLGYIKFLYDNHLQPRHDIYLYFTNFEEIGQGISVLPTDISELISLDIALSGSGTYGNEKKVCIIAKDSKTIYDYEIRKKMILAAKENNINISLDVYDHYGSDASVALTHGIDIKTACIGPCIDGSHHYERTHVDGIVETVKLLLAYL